MAVERLDLFEMEGRTTTEKWISLQEGCERAGISDRRMPRLIQSGAIRGEQVKGEWRVDLGSVESWMAMHRVSNGDLTGIDLDRPERDSTDLLNTVLSLRLWSILSLAKRLHVTAQAVQRWSVVGVPERFIPVLCELLSGTDELSDTKRIADQLVGLPEARAWSIVNATDREWQDTTGRDCVTADVRTRRIRMSIKDGIVRSASAG
jgi:hypothetical protein